MKRTLNSSGRMSAIFCARQKGVHKKHLAGSVAIGEFRRNLKRISLAFMHISRHLSPFVHVSDH
ncbi:MAG TPA: hypothetical protein VFV38_53160, partial [Ktedonobacteraceae bacterium]|nr:hypothetical protein [Ktedonobacteraceae bacterium]HEU5384216.1 hypothetical protein [Ktedonobacteraceae bacterium]